MEDQDTRRFVLLWEAHFGIGIRWATDSYMAYPLHLSLALPFFSIDVGLGRLRQKEAAP